ncbi:MAG: deoxyguanosinetriphosphate triphosphohydrolase [Chthoniobacterales bacterium]|nr:deoxyguanosinetriphosphate triphosphohydrolase [Chthoniobacterales bacterium]
MYRSREWLEEWESEKLAPWAVFSGRSLGRVYGEDFHLYRTHFQRDRARVIHSSAFRRLDGKTQVFLNGTGDHFRTRLTHTIEVASVARSIARALGLNEDLTEAIALAHDLGHPPFGHAGERALNELMAEHGGFDHNQQSLRVVQFLEHKYPNYSGLNLSYEVLEGLKKHDTVFQLPDGTEYYSPSLEAQVADVADEITYFSHDLDDGIASGLIPIERLSCVTLWSEALEIALPNLRGEFDMRRDRWFVIRCLINREVDDVIKTSLSKIEESKVRSVEDVRRKKDKIIQFSEGLRRKNLELRKFLFDNFYQHPSLTKLLENCSGYIYRLFGVFLKRRELMSSRALERLELDGLHRVVSDYIAGMTDRFLLRKLRELGEIGMC